MEIKIIPTKLKGEINIPPSKSYSHRAVIAASLADGESRIGNLNFSVDIQTTTDIMKNFGAVIEQGEDYLKITGNQGNVTIENNYIQCNESGSTIRFIIPIALSRNNGQLTIDGKGKLIERPFDTYYKIFDKQGISYKTTNGKLPLYIEGSLKADIFEVEGNISSQFITGLLYTLPLLDGDSEIVIKGPLESKGYVDLTLKILEMAGIEVKNNDYKSFLIKGNQTYKGFNYTVEGDYSQVAFWIVAGILSEEINCKNVYKDSLQGDRAIVEIVQRMGANLEINDKNIKVFPGKTKGTVIDVSQCPDIAPVLTVLAALSEGETRIINAERLRIKESDRITSMRTELNKLGADIREEGDTLVINGVDELEGGVTVDSWNDHRVAMALAIASIKCKNPILITDAGAVRKSYPNFWNDFVSMGGKVGEI